MFLFLILQLLNGTVEEMKAKSAADEWHLREGDGGYDKGQELLRDSTLQPVLSRPLLAAASAVESSTDTLVPETDVEERRKLYSSALRQEQHPHRCHAQIQDKQQPQPPLLRGPWPNLNAKLRLPEVSFWSRFLRVSLVPCGFQKISWID